MSNPTMVTRVLSRRQLDSPQIDRPKIPQKKEVTVTRPPYVPCASPTPRCRTARVAVKFPGTQIAAKTAEYHVHVQSAAARPRKFTTRMAREIYAGRMSGDKLALRTFAVLVKDIELKHRPQDRHGPTDRRTDRQTDRQTDRHRHSESTRTR